MDIKPLCDKIGNELHEGDLCTLTFQGPAVGRVMKLHNGGISLPETRGTTPAMIRVVVDITITAPPGSRLQDLLRVPDPQKEELVSRIIDSANRAQ